MGFFSSKKLTDEEEAAKKELLMKRKQARANSVFVSRASVFNYLVFEEGMELEEASNMADLWARNLNLPDSVQPKKTGISGFVDNFKEISVVIKENPEAAEWLKPLFTGVITTLVSGAAGAFLANKSQEHHEEQPTNQEPITARRLTKNE